MKISRRTFILRGSLTIAGAIGGLSAAGAVFGQSRAKISADSSDPLFSLDAGTFRKYIGTQFTVYGKNSAATGELAEVKKFEARASRDQRKRFAGKQSAECFTLVFLMPSAEFGQDFYQIFHPALGQFDIFLVPGETLQGEPTLAAVFNRL